MPGTLPQSAHHVLRFYDRGRFLCEDVAQFVTEGLDRRERVVVLARAPHWAAVREMVGPRAGPAVVSGQLTFEDADAMLARIMDGSAVSPEKFAACLNASLAGARAPLRVFGELVSLVAARGYLSAAMEIEQLGQQLADRAGAHVLCAYHLHDLTAHRDGVQQAVRCHDLPQDPRLAQGGGPVVLLADDFEDCRDLYCAYLESKGYRLVTAADGAEAVDKARATHPALVLLDVRMPRMSGIDAMRTLRDDPVFDRVPIVAVTAHALDVEREMFVSEGFTAVLPKPCLPDDLFRFLGALLPPDRDSHSI